MNKEKIKYSKSPSYISTAWKLFIKYLLLCSNTESILNISFSKRYSLYHQIPSRNQCKYIIWWFTSLLVSRWLWFLWPNLVIMVRTWYTLLNTFQFQIPSPIVPRNTLKVAKLYQCFFFPRFRKYDHCVKKKVCIPKYELKALSKLCSMSWELG